MRLISSFAQLPDADLAAKTGVILSALIGNPNFPEPWPETVPTLALLQQARAIYLDAYHAAQSRDMSKVAAKNAAKARLAELFSQVAHYIDLAAGSDLSKLAGSGFDQRQVADRHAYDGAPAAPQQVVVKHGTHKGSVDISTEAIPGARAYEIQISQADPTQESNWQHAEVSGQHKHVTLQNLTPGQTYWFRVRAIGKEEKGVWSGAVSLMVV